jgi:hypothetical protein
MQKRGATAAAGSSLRRALDNAVERYTDVALGPEVDVADKAFYAQLESVPEADLGLLLERFMGAADSDGWDVADALGFAPPAPQSPYHPPSRQGTAGGHSFFGERGAPPISTLARGRASRSRAENIRAPPPTISRGPLSPARGMCD